MKRPIVFAVLLASCVTTGPTTVNVTVMVTQTLNLAAPVASAAPNCADISKVRLVYPETLGVGVKAPISATPLDSAGNKREPRCDDADGILWSVQPSELLGVVAPQAFDTQVNGQKAGAATLSCTVGKNGTASVPVKVG